MDVLVESFGDLSRPGFDWKQTIFVDQHDWVPALLLGDIEV
jgi:hypothetical protein